MWAKTGNAMNRRIQFGSGSLHLPPPWENFDAEVPIERQLPFPDGTTAFIFASHVIEHVAPKEVWNFLVECKRILQPGGVVRLAFPDLSRLANMMTDEYRAAVRTGGHGDDPIRACIFEHGHQGAWTQELMLIVMNSIGFQTRTCSYGESIHNELHGCDRHHLTVGESIARLETCCVEGTK